jgi:5'-3' exonuclease
MFCAQLAKDGLVSAVYTRDTDALACLAPVVLTGLDGNYFKEIRLGDILERLQLTKESWIDLCVMCGTDFNSNIPRIGPIKAYYLIKTSGSIDSIADSGLDTAPLNHVRVRELFDHRQEISELPECGLVDFDELATWIVLDKLKISPSITRKRVKCKDSSILSSSMITTNIQPIIDDVVKENKE